jgi:23S rRNA (cytidine1920-2'-O)/16S rRNA (cytidine1409-2'-O)-methyltransferase
VTRRRLDLELVRRGLAPTRQAAQALVDAGRVRVAGAPASKSSRLVEPAEPLVVEGPPARFVSRGGEKLDAAVERFGIAVQGRRAIDLGASTGGFTDCLLQRGAARVVAVDVGYGQLHERIRTDPRVDVRERVNARSLRSGDVVPPPELVVADLSFISLRTVLPAVLEMCAPAADLVLLVKPQFEAGRAEVSKGRGVIRDPAVWRRVLAEVTVTLDGLGAAIMGVMASPLTGADGNAEFLVHAAAPPVPPSAQAEPVDLEAAVDEAIRRSGG